jgi:murein DD-endopeptidase MepM/ murein hydrolase activator NlpD
VLHFRPRRLTFNSQSVPRQFSLLARLGLVLLLFSALRPLPAASQPQAGASPAPFLYLPFDTPQGWRYPSAWFDHHFPSYQSRSYANHPDENACLEGKLLYPEGKTLAIGPGLEFPRLLPPAGIREDVSAPGMAGYWCAECNHGQGSYLYYDGHAGYDWGLLAGIRPGTPVLAAGSGRIIEARCPNKGTPQAPDPRGPEGCSITLRHDPPNQAYTPHYLHLAEPSNPQEQVPWPGQNGVPAVGQRVQPGQVIGRAGATGWSATGQPLLVDLHIHFEVRKNNTPVDPWGWTPYVRDPGDPEADPLQCFNGEKSYNLFVGYEPHCFGCSLPALVEPVYKPLGFLSSTHLDMEIYAPVTYNPGGSAQDAAEFVTDVSLPDGSRVTAGEQLEKIWRLRNTGLTSWNSQYALVFTSGSRLDGPASLPLGTVEPGQEVELQVTLRAPAAPGEYRSTWSLVNPQGERFGPLFWLTITAQRRTLLEALLAGASLLEQFLPGLSAR